MIDEDKHALCDDKKVEEPNMALVKLRTIVAELEAAQANLELSETFKSMEQVAEEVAEQEVWQVIKYLRGRCSHCVLQEPHVGPYVISRSSSMCMEDPEITYDAAAMTSPHSRPLSRTGGLGPNPDDGKRSVMSDTCVGAWDLDDSDTNHSAWPGDSSVPPPLGADLADWVSTFKTRLVEKGSLADASDTLRQTTVTGVGDFEAERFDPNVDDEGENKMNRFWGAEESPVVQLPSASAV